MDALLAHIRDLGIDEVATAAGSDPDVLRLENLDTDIPPPSEAIRATCAAIRSGQANSYLPFNGSWELRHAVAERLRRQTDAPFTADQVVITCGGTEGLVDALFATTKPGDEVILTSPTYAGMVNRVRLVGATPVFVPFETSQGAWRLDTDALRRALSLRTRALLIMSPSMPTGAVLSREEWSAIAESCAAADAWLIYNAAMERILFHDTAFVHPLSLPLLVERTLCVGSMSKEHRMIGWRIGWVAAPSGKVHDVHKAHVYNVVTPPGIAQHGATVALRHGEASFRAALRQWELRHDVLCSQLARFPIVRAQGGWSLLLDVAEIGWSGAEASSRLLGVGRIAATPMTGWGDEQAGRYVRLVFSNEPVRRLREVGERMRLSFRAG